MTTDANVVVWEELDFGHVKPLRTASLTFSQQGSSLHLVREKGGYSVRVWASLTSAFLPEGYPDSVTRDYLPFQFWDTLQGLSTYIRSMLSTKALLSGIGVGQTTATVMGATFQWFLRDFTGMLGGVLFTIYQGSNLDSKAKQWRLVADFMNDIGMLLDLISPLFPSLFMTLLCVGSLARSVTGVASGATRAALTQHFTLEQNAADISAKEGSQETAATLSGMLLGLLLAHATSGHPFAIWICFLALTGFHMFANYKAVRCLCLTSLNKERAKIALQTYFVTGKVLSPDDVSRQEVVLPQISSIRQLGQDFFHDQNIILGARISSLGVPGGWKNFGQLVHRFSKENYLLVTEGKKISVVLHRQAKKEDFLKAYVQALVTAIFMEKFGSIREADMHSGDWMEKSYPTFMSKLQDGGWNLNRVHVFPDSWRAEWHTSELKSE